MQQYSTPCEKYIRMVDNIQYLFSTIHNIQSTMIKHTVSINRYIFYQFLFNSVLCLGYYLQNPEMLMPCTFSQHIFIYIQFLIWPSAYPYIWQNIGPGLSILLYGNSKGVYRFFWFHYECPGRRVQIEVWILLTQIYHFNQALKFTIFCN